MALLVIPKGAFQQHVRTLAGVARLASTPELRRKIIQAGSPKEVLEAIYELELESEAGSASELTPL